MQEIPDVGEQEQQCCASMGAAGPPNTDLWHRCGKGRSGLGQLLLASACPKTSPKLRAGLVLSPCPPCYLPQHLRRLLGIFLVPFARRGISQATFSGIRWQLGKPPPADPC